MKNVERLENVERLHLLARARPSLRWSIDLID